jgi:hypothetical protein
VRRKKLTFKIGTLQYALYKINDRLSAQDANL